MQTVCLLSVLLAVDLSIDSLNRTDLPSWRMEILNWEETRPSFAEGTYFWYSGPTVLAEAVEGDSNSPMNSPEMILGYLFGLGIDVKEAWYKPGDSSCRDKPIFVQSAFVIRVRDSADKLLLQSMRFIQTKTPGIGRCAHYVRHYVFR